MKEQDWMKLAKLAKEAGEFELAEKLEREAQAAYEQAAHERAVAYYDALDDGYVDDGFDDMDYAMAA